jgi:hypothetical protein
MDCRYCICLVNVRKVLRGVLTDYCNLNLNSVGVSVDMTVTDLLHYSSASCYIIHNIK